MLEQAVKKLYDEINQNKDNPAISAVGNFLIGYIRQCPNDAEKIMREKKTIAGAMDEMKKQAQKKQKNGYAVVAPDEGFKIVMNYFGIKDDLKTAKTVLKPVKSVPAPKENVPNQAESAFDINLDDLL